MNNILQGNRNMDQELSKAFIDHRDTLYGFIFALLRDHDAAEDVFQNVGLAIIEASAKGETVNNFIPWAKTLCRRRVADHLRRHIRLRQRERAMQELGPLIEQAFDEYEPDPEDNRKRIALLDDCLKNLSRRARDLVDARYAQQKGIAAIADAFGWKQKAVTVALSKARKSLSECVQRRLRLQGASDD